MADGGSEDDVTEAGTDPDDDLQILKLGPEYAEKAKHENIYK